MGDAVVIHMNGAANGHYTMPLMQATPDHLTQLCPRRPDSYGMKEGQTLSHIRTFPKKGKFFEPALRSGQEIVLFFEGNDVELLTGTMEGGAIAGGKFLPYALAFSGVCVGAGLCYMAYKSNDIGDKGLEKVAGHVDKVGKAVRAVARSVDGMGDKHHAGLEFVKNGLGGAGLLVAFGFTILAIARRVH